MSRNRRKPQTFTPTLAEALEAREMMAAHIAVPVQVAPLSAPSPASSTNPHVAFTQLLVKGKSVTGLTVTFNQPMTPGPVSNVQNYFLYDVRTRSQTPIHLRSASFNPSTNTVTLIPAARLKPSGAYFVTNVDLNNKLTTLADLNRASSQTNFTDLQGHPLDDFGYPSGAFADVVTRNPTPGKVKPSATP